MKFFSSNKVRLLVLSSLALLAFKSAPTVAAEKPNILVVLVDDMGWSDISCYGAEIQTPAIDSLAANGLKFRYFYNEARCSPTRNALMSGQHMQSVGDNPNYELPDMRMDNNVTIPEVLSANGYRTYLSGKWHLGETAEGRDPISRGFQHVYCDGVNADGGGGDADYWGDTRSNAFISTTGEMAPIDYSTTNFFLTDAQTDYVLKYFDYHFDKGDDAPFFIYLAYNAPHFVLQAPKELINLYTDVGQDPATTNDVDIYQYEAGWDVTRQLRFDRQRSLGVIGPEHRLSPRSYKMKTGPAIPAWDTVDLVYRNDLARRMATYAALVHNVDNNMARIISGLQAKGALDNTLILFLSDNGGCAEAATDDVGLGVFGSTADGVVYTNDFPLTGDRLAEMGQFGEPKLKLGAGWANVNNTPLRFYKRATHEGGIRTPLIVHWPAEMPEAVKGSWTDDRGHVIDIMTTLLDVSASTYPPTNPAGYAVNPMQGHSFLPAIYGQELDDHDIFIEHKRGKAVFRGKWKLTIKNFGMPGVDSSPTLALELYNMEEDPSEMNNLAAVRTDLLSDLIAAYNTWVSSQAPPLPGVTAFNHTITTTSTTKSALPPADAYPFAMPQGNEMFYDTFSRANNLNLDAARTGISGTYAGMYLEPVDNTYDQGYNSIGTQITGSRLRLISAETGLMINFTNTTGYSVEAVLDGITDAAGFGVGLSQTEAAGGDFRNIADCFVELDASSNINLYVEGVLSNSVSVGSSSGTLLAAFESDDVTLYFNGSPVLTTAFTRDNSTTNYIGLSSRAGTAYLDNLIIRPLPLADSLSTSYALGKGLSGSNTDIAADPDNDGIINLAEWAFGTDPAVADSHPRVLLIQTDSTGEIQLFHQQLKEFAAAGIQYRIHYSDSMQTPFSDWPELAPIVHSESTATHDANYIVRDLGLPEMDPSEKYYFLLTAEQQ